MSVKRSGMCRRSRHSVGTLARASASIAQDAGETATHSLVAISLDAIDALARRSVAVGRNAGFVASAVSTCIGCIDSSGNGHSGAARCIVCIQHSGTAGSRSNGCMWCIQLRQAGLADQVTARGRCRMHRIHGFQRGWPLARRPMHRMLEAARKRGLPLESMHGAHTTGAAARAQAAPIDHVHVAHRTADAASDPADSPAPEPYFETSRAAYRTPSEPQNASR